MELSRKKYGALAGDTERRGSGRCTRREEYGREICRAVDRERSGDVRPSAWGDAEAYGGTTIKPRRDYDAGAEEGRRGEFGQHTQTRPAPKGWVQFDATAVRIGDIRNR
jgi:hypothetical protein